MFYFVVPFRDQFPLEIREHIIDQLRYDVRSLRQCALTCCLWNVRSRFHLLSAIRIGSWQQHNSVKAYFRINPSSRFFVHSITTFVYYPKTNSFLDFTLLSQFPNLRQWYLHQPESSYDVYDGHDGHALALYHALRFIKSATAMNSCLQTLSLCALYLASSADVRGLLKTLPNLKQFICDHVNVAIPIDVDPNLPAYRGTLPRLRILKVS